MKKIGIVGCGTIGTAVAEAIRTRFSNIAELIAVYDIDTEKAKGLGKVMSINELVDAVDLVVESASPAAVKELVPLVLEKGKEILVMSTGGLLDIPLQKGLHIPSGAIIGLDGISSAAQSNITKITLTTKKPPKALGLSDITSDTTVFEGSVEEAIKLFPKNINVCATLALVSKKPELITVKIIASPGLKRNTHQVELEGDFGHITCCAENEPSPTNPKTSYLAVLSAIATLEKILLGH